MWNGGRWEQTEAKIPSKGLLLSTSSLRVSLSTIHLLCYSAYFVAMTSRPRYSVGHCRILCFLMTKGIMCPEKTVLLQHMSVSSTSWLSRWHSMRVFTDGLELIKMKSLCTSSLLKLSILLMYSKLLWCFTVLFYNTLGIFCLIQNFAYIIDIQVSYCFFFYISKKMRYL